MTGIMLLLIRILALRLDQHRTIATTAAYSSSATKNSLEETHLNSSSVALADDQSSALWSKLTKQGPDAIQTTAAGFSQVDITANLHHVNRRQRSTMAAADVAAVEENTVLPSRVKKPLIGAHQHQIYSDVDAVAGRLVRLPCYVRPLGPADSISLVLWYRGEDISGTPIYSVDARHTQFQKAQHFASKPYQDRQLMNFTLTRLDVDTTESAANGSASSSDSSSSSRTKPSSASTAHLYLMPVEESDAGLYWCRVDYKYERTTISIVTVNVIVPPRQLQIQIKADSDNCQSKKACSLSANQTIVLNEDSSVTLVCSSDGGKPFPLLNWFRNDVSLRNEIFHSLTPNNLSLQSELHLTQIRPDDHNAVLKCLSSNDNRTFLSSQIRLKVNTKPSQVDLVLENMSQSASVLAGTEVSFRCRSFGSRPAANHTWTIAPGERHLPIAKQNVQLDSERHHQGTSAADGVTTADDWDMPLVTESTVHLVLQPEDHGQQIVCSANNKLLHFGTLQSSLKLNVTFAPKVTLQQLPKPPSGDSKGHQSLTSGFAIRGDELHLHCNITANPLVDSVVWYLNSRKLNDETSPSDDPKYFTISKNGTLLSVFNITDEWQGYFQCWGSNPFGTGFSNQFQIQILYKPQCITPMQTIPANVGSLVTMICDVEANPANVTFFWQSKHKDLRDLRGQSSFRQMSHHVHITDRAMKSRLEIQIESGDNFGQYLCYAQNLAGVQDEPCFYNVYENTIKQQLLCESNISSQIIQVQCQPEPITTSEPPAQVQAEPANRSFNVIAQPPRNVLFNLKIFKDKRQLINITSTEPNFLLAVDELQQSEFKSGALNRAPNVMTEDAADSAHLETTNSASHLNESVDQSLYMMLISALVDGRLTSDVSLSFKVPIEPETNAIIKEQMDRFDNDLDLPETATSSSYATATAHNLSISRYQKKLAVNPANESQKEPKDTSAASFTTSVTISQLPLIWTAAFLLIIALLVTLILLVLTRLHISRRRKKPHVRFSRHHQMITEPLANTATTAATTTSDLCNGLSSKEYLMEDEVAVVNERADAEKESIQLFTLANFDPSYAYGGGCGKDSPGPGAAGTLLSTRLRHVDLRATLPDLMTDTFAFDQLQPLSEYEMESSQHHNLYIIHKPAQAMDSSAIGGGGGALCHDLLSFQSSVTASTEHSNTDPDLFGVLPTRPLTMSMSIDSSSRHCSSAEQ